MTLLTAYERLLEEEASALARRDIPYLNEQILPRKAPLIRGFQRRADEFRARRQLDPELDQRLDALLERQRENTEHLARLRSENRRELRTLTRETRKATGVRQSYGRLEGRPTPASPRFSA
jgi:hypothetical protein